jgi:hypothetical protein
MQSQIEDWRFSPPVIVKSHSKEPPQIASVKTHEKSQTACLFCHTSILAQDGTLSELVVAQQRIRELENYIKFNADLNLISPYITRYYSEVFRHLKRNFYSKNNDKQSSMPYTNWVDLFSAASSESGRYDDFTIDVKPINLEIASVMQTMGGLTLDDWDSLQAIRQDRNKQGHPQLNDSKVFDCVETRWHKHTAYDALRKMMKYLQSQRTAVSSRAHRRKECFKHT